jgi:hypothetical protein
MHARQHAARRTRRIDRYNGLLLFTVRTSRPPPLTIEARLALRPPRRDKGPPLPIV